MHIKILGAGCARCHALTKTVNEVLDELQVDVVVEEVKELKKILEYPILITPGLVINEQVVSSSKVPTRAEISQFITNVLTEEKQKNDA